MRTVKKTWVSHNMPHAERMEYKDAINELEEIFHKNTKEEIKEKLDTGTRLGNGKGKIYQILVIKKTKKRGGKIMNKKPGNPPGKRTIWIDEKLHKKLKTLASQDGKKMGIFVEGLINKSLEGDKRNAK